MVMRKSGRTASGGTAPSGRIPARGKLRRQRHKASAVAPPLPGLEALRELRLVTLRLRAIYGTAVAAELALRHQAADEDIEIADCLRAGVCDPIGDQVQRLQNIAKRFR